ncbi:MAG: hypothetical protein Q8L11_03315 [Candidatus Moranbacteria bacterium]|nr:hypothetical protein [bacterium]MDP1833936.1 hypothetical protein [Candidatus Moranbacteria bacterium]
MFSLNVEVHGYGYSKNIGIQIKDEIFALFADWEIDELAVTLYDDKSDRPKFISTPFLRVYHNGGDKLQEVIDKLGKLKYRIELVKVEFIIPV